MNRFIVSFVFIFSFPFLQTAFPCTAFLLKSDNYVLVGNNYDWISKEGCLLINKRNVHKIAIGIDSVRAASWISKYGSVTFNQYGKEFPQGGINEKGLVVITLVLSESIYPDPAGYSENIDEAQWIQYQIDNYSSVQEVIDHMEQTGIQPHALNLHYYIADKSGNSAVVEFINGKTIISNGNNFPYKAITNNTFQWSREYYEKAYHYSPKMPRSSINRFSRAVELTGRYDTKLPVEKGVDYCFSTLDDVPIKGWTVWSIVYDITHMRVYWKPSSNKKIKYIDVSSFDYSEGSPVKYFDINSKSEGKVDDRFGNYSYEENRRIVEKTYKKLDIQFNGKDFDQFCLYQMEPSKYRKTDMFNNTCNLTIVIKGLDNGYGTAFIGIMNNAKNFRKINPYRGAEVPLRNNEAKWVVYNIPKGEYASAYFFDANGNDKTDMILGIIPKEPVGFSNNVKGPFIKPSFKKAKFILKDNEQTLEMQFIKK